MKKAQIPGSAPATGSRVTRQSANSPGRAPHGDRCVELFREAPFAAVLLDSHGTIRDCNDATAHMLRASRQDLHTRKFVSFLPQEDQLGFIEQLGLACATRFPGEIAFTLALDTGALPARAHIIPSADTDIPSAWLLILDSTQPSAQDEARYFDLFNVAPVGYILLDRNGVVQESNETASRMVGVRAAALVGRPFILCVSQGDRGGFLEHIRRVRSLRASVEAELTLETRDGRQVSVHVSTKPSAHQAYPDSSWSILIDRTEQLRLQEAHSRAEQERLEARRDAAMARARSDAKDRFLAALSHELRTPLTPALNATTLLLNVAGLPREAERLVAMIRRNIELEVRLIEDLLDVTRIGRSKLRLERSTLDFHALLSDALRMVAPEADARRLTVTSELDAGRAFVDGDPIRLRQVVWNLINNAVKFTPSGGQILVRTSNDESGTLKFTVSDTGIGFEPDAVSRLFVPFEQESHSGANRGLGLGLAICQGIVEAHGGRIWARSAGPGQGSTFEVELATLSPDLLKQERTVPVSRTPIVGDNGDRLRILVVEDDRDSAETLASLLGLHGHSVETASRLEEGIKRCDEAWDVIITDIGLPDGSGLALARHVRGRPGGPRSLVALSGFGTASDIDASQQAGFDVHLTKPVDISRVLDIFAALPQR
jgi:PAS domain S-box-containing protein